MQALVLMHLSCLRKRGICLVCIPVEMHQSGTHGEATQFSNVGETRAEFPYRVQWAGLQLSPRDKWVVALFPLPKDQTNTDEMRKINFFSYKIELFQNRAKTPKVTGQRAFD